MVALGAVVWTYWIAPFLVAGVVLLFLGLGIGYLIKVVRPQYPPGEFPTPGASRRR
jgi:hypothetical protein